MTEEQLLFHAARCIRLAEICRDPAVAKKLRALAQDYRHLVQQPPDRPMIGTKMAGARTASSHGGLVLDLGPPLSGTKAAPGFQTN